MMTFSINNILKYNIIILVSIFAWSCDKQEFHQKANQAEITCTKTRLFSRSSDKEQFELNERVTLLAFSNSEYIKTDLIHETDKWKSNNDKIRSGNFNLFAALYPPADKIYGDKDNPYITIDAGDNSLESMLWSLAVRKNNAINLDFTHAMSKITVIIDNAEAIGLRDNEIKADILTAAKAELYPKSQITVTGNETIRKQMIQKGNELSAIIPSQKIDDIRDWINMSFRGKKLRIIPDKNLHVAEAGKEIRIRINLDENQNNEVKYLWTEGMMPPDKEEIEKATNMPDYKITRKEGDLWFDCNKVDPSYNGVDGQMCWAASASNMIHWWLELNKNKYPEKINGIKHKIEDMRTSEIFQLFKDNYNNKGNWTEMGLNWFFIGTPGIDMKTNAAKAGFFKSELQNKAIIYSTHITMQKQEFSDKIKESLQGGKAIAIYYRIRGFSAHAINVWGAELKNNTVEALYICDNNDGKSDAVGSLRRAKVGYPKNKPYLYNSLGEPKFEVYGFVTLSSK